VTRNDSGRALPVLILILLVAAIAYLGFAALRLGPTPDVKIVPALPAIGARTPVKIEVDGKGRGFRSVKVELVQGSRVEPLGHRDYAPAAPWSLSSKGTGSDEIKVEVGRDTIKGLSQAPATIRVTAERAGSWLRSPEPIVREAVLPVRLTPPSLGVLSTATYVTQGGSEAVVYRVGETAVRDGVEAGEWFFPGFPLPGGAKGERFAFFAVPYDTGNAAAIRLVAIDDVGNRAQVSFIDKFTPEAPRSDTIRLDDAFLGRVVPAILSQTPELTDRGSTLQNFLAINGELHTPTPDCFLNGITRQTVMGLAKARGIKVVERTIKPEELGQADEVFLTGSAAEVTPVGEIIGTVGHYRFTPGTICRLMWEDYDRLVGKQVAASAAAE
jgi:hypothetical protein